MGHWERAAARVTLASPLPVWCRGTCSFITATHSGGLTTVMRTQSRPCHIRKGKLMLGFLYSCTHNQTYVCVNTHMTAYHHTPPGMCHHCEHHPRGTDIHVQSQSTAAQTHMQDHPGPCWHCHRWPLADQVPPPCPAQAASYSPGPWVAGPAQQRWTGAGTGSGCGLPGSPGSGSFRCPSPPSWHLLGGGRGGVSPSPTLRPPTIVATAQGQVNPGQNHIQEAGSWEPQDASLIS